MTCAKSAKSCINSRRSVGRSIVSRAEQIETESGDSGQSLTDSGGDGGNELETFHSRLGQGRRRRQRRRGRTAPSQAEGGTRNAKNGQSVSLRHRIICRDRRTTTRTKAKRGRERESFKLVAVVGARTGDDGGNGSSSSSTSANLAIGGSEGQIEEIAAEGGNTCQKAATEPARGGEAGLKREKGHATGCVKSDRQ